MMQRSPAFGSLAYETVSNPSPMMSKTPTATIVPAAPSSKTARKERSAAHRGRPTIWVRVLERHRPQQQRVDVGRLGCSAVYRELDTPIVLGFDPRVDGEEGHTQPHFGHIWFGSFDLHRHPPV